MPYNLICYSFHVMRHKYIKSRAIAYEMQDKNPQIGISSLCEV